MRRIRVLRNPPFQEQTIFIELSIKSRRLRTNDVTMSGRGAQILSMPRHASGVAQRSGGP